MARGRSSPAPGSGSPRGHRCAPPGHRAPCPGGTRRTGRALEIARAAWRMAWPMRPSSGVMVNTTSRVRNCFAPKLARPTSPSVQRCSQRPDKGRARITKAHYTTRHAQPGTSRPCGHTAKCWLSECSPRASIWIRGASLAGAISERKTRFELATLTLARRCSTTEPLPHDATAVRKQVGKERLNSHGLLHVILSHARLPVPTLPQVGCGGAPAPHTLR